MLLPDDVQLLSIISQALRLLTSPDEQVKSMATAELYKEVQERLRLPKNHAISPEDLKTFFHLVSDRYRKISVPSVPVPVTIKASVPVPVPIDKIYRIRLLHVVSCSFLTILQTFYSNLLIL